MLLCEDEPEVVEDLKDFEEKESKTVWEKLNHIFWFWWSALTSTFRESRLLDSPPHPETRNIIT